MITSTINLQSLKDFIELLLTDQSCVEGEEIFDAEIVGGDGVILLTGGQESKTDIDAGRSIREMNTLGLFTLGADAGLKTGDDSDWTIFNPASTRFV